MAAYLICLLLENQMKSVGRKQEANTYLQTDRIDITAREDHFINVTQTRVKIGKEHNKGGGIGVVLRFSLNIVVCYLLAYGLAQPGDIVTLSPACSSFDLFKNFEERGNTFRAIVESLH